MNGLTLIKSQRGAASRLARKLGVARSTVSRWKVVPAELVVRIERATGIDRAMLRPDLYRMKGRQRYE